MPVVTGFYGALLALLGVFLAIYVSNHRRRTHTGLGDGGDAGLQRAVRMFGNFAEYAPLALILIGLLEMNGGSRTMLHVYGAAIVVGRLAHAWGLSTSAGESIGRLAGMLLTFLPLIGLSVQLLMLTASKAFA